MKFFIVVLVALTSLSAFARLYTVNSDVLMIRLPLRSIIPPAENTIPKQCRDAAKLQETKINTNLAQQGISGKMVITGVISETNELGDFCYLLLNLQDSTHEIVEKTDQTERFFRSNQREEALSNLVSEITNRSGYQFHTMTNYSQGILENKVGYTVNSYYLSPR